MLTYASAQAMPPKKQAKKRQRQTTLFGSTEDAEAGNGCSSEVANVDGAEDRPIAPLAASDSEVTRLSPSL